ncbi:MltF family protein [Desulfotalea psychrophila]|nr:lytic transglycosylase F [Desulfotalea psychrophila]
MALLLVGQTGLAQTPPPLKLTSRPLASEHFFSDSGKIEKRRFIRFLVPYSKTFFFLDGAQPRGLIYDRIMAFERALNKKLKTKHIKIHAVLIPTPRKKLLEGLMTGKGDVAAGNLTITPERLKKVDFTKPFLTGVNELLVTNQLSRQYRTVFELTGSTIYVRKSSSYYTSLRKTNLILADYRLAPIKIESIDDRLEDEDILELVNANIIEKTVVDQHKADFWAEIFPSIRVQHRIKISSGGEIAWATRKDNPFLNKEINEFVRKNREGTLAGNMLFRKYLKKTDYIANILQDDTAYKKLLPTFKKYGKEYNFDYFLLIALAYQESRLNQSARSNMGAVGIMQILPSTAQSKYVNIKDIHTIDANIHAGTKYLRFIADRYFPASENISSLDRAFFTFASYNAGPARISAIRKKAAKSGYNANIWFQNVEITAAKEIGRETVQYVSNIFKYYTAYSLLANTESNKIKESWLLGEPVSNSPTLQTPSSHKWLSTDNKREP